MHTNGGTYSTTNFYLACSLMAKEVQLLDIVPDAGSGSSAKRYRFRFSRPDDLSELLAAYHDERDCVPTKRISGIIRDLKNRLYAAMNAQEQS